jgi:SAM-dependent methyltransferase
MAIQLDQVVPFGRSLDEYQNMFKLTPADLGQPILGVGDGPASFNAEATYQGSQVISVDPIYEFTGEEILQRFNAVADGIINQVRATPEDWVWSYHGSPDALLDSRRQTIQRFIADYEDGQRTGRYRVGALPHLDFPDQSFDLALCSHFLFLYSDLLDLEFHQAALAEMLRVSREVRIFPLLTLGLNPSPHLQPLMQQLGNRSYQITIETVPYEFQRGGNQMLRICNAPSCE